MVCVSASSAFAERKVALVVGNSQYKNPALTLSNPKNDAEDVATMLRSLDFEEASLLKQLLKRVIRSTLDTKSPELRPQG